jgi:hypothetical protein
VLPIADWSHRYEGARGSSSIPEELRHPLLILLRRHSAMPDTDLTREKRVRSWGAHSPAATCDDHVAASGLDLGGQQ